MSKIIEFVRNYEDHSTKNGFQFEFACDRCGKGFRTEFRSSVVGTASGMLDKVGGLFGGLLGNAANLTQDLRSAAWTKARDEAFEEAVNEIKPQFVQCPRCSSWICRQGCWNAKKGLCKHCAPDLGVEMAAAQASKSVEEVWAHAAMAEEDKKLGKEYWREGIRATCPQCEAPLSGNVKFCPECGAAVKTKRFCTGCGAEMSGPVKFCPECGAKQG